MTEREEEMAVREGLVTNYMLLHLKKANAIVGGHGQIFNKNKTHDKSYLSSVSDKSSTRAQHRISPAHTHTYTHTHTHAHTQSSTASHASRLLAVF